jgi:hypothetical protein
MTEEERAELYREQVASRAQMRRERFLALAGNREAREALDAAWMPPLLAGLEAGACGDDLEFLEEMFVRIPERDLFVTEIPDDQLL